MSSREKQRWGELGEVNECDANFLYEAHRELKTELYVNCKKEIYIDQYCFEEQPFSVDLRSLISFSFLVLHAWK